VLAAGPSQTAQELPTHWLLASTPRGLVSQQKTVLHHCMMLGHRQYSHWACRCCLGDAWQYYAGLSVTCLPCDVVPLILVLTAFHDVTSVDEHDCCSTMTID
jgi:hypothetical protein